jgi:hypothetical protein
MHAVIEVHETPGLLTVTPDGNDLFAGQLGHRNLPAYSRRSLSLLLVGAVRAVQIVITRHARRQSEILTEVPALRSVNNFSQPYPSSGIAG